MEKHNDFIHPYIPNSADSIQKEMLELIGVIDIDDLFKEIPDALRFKGRLNLPAPLISEFSLKKELESITRSNKTTKEYLSFLGAGCFNHFVPAVCDEINQRSEFLTGYAGEPFEDHGRFQALFEYASLMGELLNMDAVSIPTYDFGQAISSSLRMASRITGKTKVLIPDIISPEKRAIIKNYTKGILDLTVIKTDKITGGLNTDDLKSKMSSDIAAVYFEYPSFTGIIDQNFESISDVIHENNALCVVGVDPSCLGIFSSPSDFGADIVCGDIQPLGLHMSCGGNHAGFIASEDSEKFIMEYPTRLFGIESTVKKGEYGFGDVTFDRTSLGSREKGKEFIGTAAALNGITAGVYLALLGPSGMKDLGTTIFNNTDYLKHSLSGIKNIDVLFPESISFKEVCVKFHHTDPSNVNKKLLEKQIFGCVDISPLFSNTGMFCTTEIHSKKDIDELCNALELTI